MIEIPKYVPNCNRNIGVQVDGDGAGRDEVNSME